MLRKVLESEPNTKFLLVGFSMGGNIVCKYIGEIRPSRPNNIIGAITICQGYDAYKGIQFLLEWRNFSRLYLFSMTENMRSVILKHKEALFTDEVKQKCNIDERKVLSAATLPELDEVYTRRIFGLRSAEELYSLDSSVNYMHNIRVPVIFINAKDDPIVHPDLLNIPENFASSHKNCMYIETDHGGHLGFYENGYVIPGSNTWIDRTIVSLVTALSNNQ